MQHFVTKPHKSHKRSMKSKMMKVEIRELSVLEYSYYLCPPYDYILKPLNMQH